MHIPCNSDVSICCFGKSRSGFLRPLTCPKLYEPVGSSLLAQWSSTLAFNKASATSYGKQEDPGEQNYSRERSPWEGDWCPQHSAQWQRSNSSHIHLLLHSLWVQGEPKTEARRASHESPRCESPNRRRAPGSCQSSGSVGCGQRCRQRLLGWCPASLHLHPTTVRLLDQAKNGYMLLPCKSYEAQVLLHGYKRETRDGGRISCTMQEEGLLYLILATWHTSQRRGSASRSDSEDSWRLGNEKTRIISASHVHWNYRKLVCASVWLCGCLCVPIIQTCNQDSQLELHRSMVRDCS